MTRNEVIEIVSSKIAGCQWHWFQYHFAPINSGLVHPICRGIVDSCLVCERKIPGFTEIFSERLASYRDVENSQPHYEQIIQLLAELLVLRRICEVEIEDARYELEPRIGDSRKNPELGVFSPDGSVFVEVKCREFIEHHNARADSAISVPSRTAGVRECAESALREGESLVLPRDNAVKDFLVSADQKFAGFKSDCLSSLCVLVVVWDDFVYEAVSALLSQASGLLTPNSFYRNDEEPVLFENIDAVVLVRHSHRIVFSTRECFPEISLSDPLVWSFDDARAPKVVIPVAPVGDAINKVCDLFGAVHIEELSQNPDYTPQDVVIHF